VGDAVRPSADAPFECPLTGVPLNGRQRTFLHKPSGLLFTESGAKKVPKVAQELILESCRKLLDTQDANGQKGKKGKQGASARAAADALVARGGKWEDSELLVVNPEGADADAANALLLCLSARVRSERMHAASAQSAFAGRCARRLAPLRACMRVPA
jgi:hypothetical protein